ncbi:MAG: glycine cleavage system protein GcvH [Rhizobacter sp.]|nr:glycine cleavage system protein GcvH [Bacteriovorax sp.]
MSNNIPVELKYTKDHEWTKIEGDTVTIGITDFAQSALGDIVFVELPEVGKTLNHHQTFGVVESIKSVSDLFSPIAGTVLEVNKDLVNAPEKCNTEPYGSAWMIKVKLSNPDELNNLLSASDYQNFLSTL